MRFALDCAIADRQSLADAWEHTKGPEYREALAEMAAFRKLKCTLFGDERTACEIAIAGARTVTLSDLRKLVDETSGETNA